MTNMYSNQKVMLIEKEGSNGNNTKSFSIYVIDIMSERSNEQDLLEQLHNTKKGSKGKKEILQSCHLEQKN